MMILAFLLNTLLLNIRKRRVEGAERGADSLVSLDAEGALSALREDEEMGVEGCVG